MAFNPETRTLKALLVTIPNQLQYFQRDLRDRDYHTAVWAVAGGLCAVFSLSYLPLIDTYLLLRRFTLPHQK